VIAVTLEGMVKLPAPVVVMRTSVVSKAVNPDGAPLPLVSIVAKQDVVAPCQVAINVPVTPIVIPPTLVVGSLLALLFQLPLLRFHQTLPLTVSTAIWIVSVAVIASIVAIVAPF
jgi:hypothetical protein